MSSIPSATSEAESDQKTPEELGALAAYDLLQDISRGGCIDKGMEWIACLLMALGSEDVGRVRIAGPLDSLLCVLQSRVYHRFSRYPTEFANMYQRIHFLRDLKDFFGVTMKIRQLQEQNVYILSCVGIGYSNIAKRM